MELKAPPQCDCGNGLMLLRTAGNYSTRPGQQYYICPLGIKHRKKFFWYDEYHGRNVTSTAEQSYTTENSSSEESITTNYKVDVVYLSDDEQENEKEKFVVVEKKIQDSANISPNFEQKYTTHNMMDEYKIISPVITSRKRCGNQPTSNPSKRLMSKAPTPYIVIDSSDDDTQAP